MHGLISQDILNDILSSTGAYDDELSDDRHIYQAGAIDTKKFTFNIKRRSEFNFGNFDNGLNAYTSIVERIWESYGFSGLKFAYKLTQNVDPHEYQFREKSFCSQLNQDGCRSSIFLYVSNDPFYKLMNVYLGGKPTDAYKVRSVLTEIEYIFHNELVARLSKNFSHSLKYIANLEILPVKNAIDNIDQLRNFEKKYVSIEFFLSENEDKPIFSFLIPDGFIKFLSKRMEEFSDSENRKLDPIWRKIITDVVLNSYIDFKISVGEIKMPFAKSYQLQVGDVFDWEKSNSKIMLIDEVRTRLIGEMGVVGENYAIKVEDVFK